MCLKPRRHRSFGVFLKIHKEWSGMKKKSVKIAAVIIGIAVIAWFCMNILFAEGIDLYCGTGVYAPCGRRGRNF